MPPLQVGFVGCGLIAGTHARALEALRGSGVAAAELSYVHDVDEVRAERFAQRFGAAVGTLDDVVRHSQAVYVCTSTDGHATAVGAAAEAGCPIFCEKPLSRNLEDSIALAAAAASVPVQVGLVLRTAPVFRELARIIAEGSYGRPMAVLVRDDQFVPIQGHYASTWRSDVNRAGAGALLEHSIHDIDVVQWCFGPVHQVAAVMGQMAAAEGIEDSASVLLQTATGLAVSLVSVWHHVLSRPSTRRVEVLLDEAFVSLDDDFTGPIRLQTSDHVEIRECPPPAWVVDVTLESAEAGIAVRPYLEENRAFVDSVVNGTPPWPGLDEALSAHRVVDACYRSARAGAAPVSLEA